MMKFKTFRALADDFFAHMPKEITPEVAFYSGAISGMLILMQAASDAERDAIREEILEFMRKYAKGDAP